MTSDTVGAAAAQPTTCLDSFANLSTGHVTDEVRAVLDKEDYEPWVDQLVMFPPREYGWFIYVPPIADLTPPADAKDVDPSSYWAIPQSLRDCFDAARADGACWILFDRDEDRNDALPFYEW